MIKYVKKVGQDRFHGHTRRINAVDEQGVGGGGRGSRANFIGAAGRLQHLTKILQKDLRDLNVVFGKSSANMTLEEGVGSVQEGGDNSWGSTSTLRASALK